MILAVVVVVAGLASALGVSLNVISKLKWDIELSKAHARELERQIEKMQTKKQSFAEFNLIVEESA